MKARRRMMSETLPNPHQVENRVEEQVQKKQVDIMIQVIMRYRKENEFLKRNLRRVLIRAKSLQRERITTREEALEFFLRSETPAEALASEKDRVQAEECRVNKGVTQDQDSFQLPEILSAERLGTECHTRVRDVLEHGDAFFNGLQKLRGGLSTSQLNVVLHLVAARVA